MTEAEAIERANRYTLAHKQVVAEPIEVHCIRGGDAPASWWISYGTGIDFPMETAAGATIDDGAYVLKVDQATGEVSVLQ
jgi:hypothetical protein